MKFSLLQGEQGQFDFDFSNNSNLSLNENENLLENSEEENLFSFPLSSRKINDKDDYQEPLYLCEKKNSFDLNNINNEFNKENDKNIEAISHINSINFNDNCINLNQISMLSTSNSFSLANIGVKKDEIILESQEGFNREKDNLDENVFKCDFLEKISLGFDEDIFTSSSKNRKNKLDLDDPKSLLAAIINLMKEKGPVEIKVIISNLEPKKDIFRKANGSRYKQDFNKLIRTTLNNNPDIFYKEKEGNKYFFIENKSEYYLQKKRERDLDKVLFNLKKKNTFLPINTKIQLDKVNSTIKRMEKKYKDDKKYHDVMICIDLFKNLINKYLFLIKKDKSNSLYEFSVLNEKIIDICHTLDKIEKGELFFKTEDNSFENRENEYNNNNSKNINFVGGQNNYFNEPPDKI